MQNICFATGPCFLSSESSGCRCRSAQSPPGHCGGASATPRRGDTQAPPGYFLPNHSSLFTKKPSPFHMGWYFGKAPTVNPSVKNQRFLPAPFSKGALRAVPADNSARWLSAIRYCPSNARYRRSAKAPLAKGGCLGTAEAGGFRGWQVST